ncbi:FixH family protein [Fulvimarina sp. 2208YS6-2-32]|uniref:FixH family protein n=1 Tax=Fulvimarina uroteuthidis TaxID=3098149 RepID=A0ABU5I4V1_9HYPH|nr:FixH family protein [Fulvimarina sp. 2208YS6-2-32]MDY8109824.1 FixH family protein [Fulvimarina sp. 2208YS6-2-32]
MLDILLARRAFTGWHMLAIMVLFFGTVITVNVYMASRALSTWSGLVVENSYVASQTFDTDVADRRRQVELGYALEASYADETVTIALMRDDTPLRIASAEGFAGRPVTAMEDRPLAFTIDGTGTATAAMHLPSGSWKADVTVVTIDGEILRRALRFVVTEAEARVAR